MGTALYKLNLTILKFNKTKFRVLKNSALSFIRNLLVKSRFIQVIVRFCKDFGPVVSRFSYFFLFTLDVSLDIPRAFIRLKGSPVS